MAYYLIADTETASLRSGIVEVAWMWVDENLKILDEQCHRVNPERKIDPGARAVHGISDEDVANCPTIKQICAGFTKPVDGIGHNISFDKQMLKGAIEFRRTLCTLEVARQYIKDTTNSKLETLQKELGLPVRTSHSALGDIHTCRDLLLYVLPKTGVDLETLFQRSEQPRVLHTMPFGKHEGKPMLEVPEGYRNWLLTQKIDKNLLYTLTKLKGL